MLINKDYENIALIKATAIHVWGENCVFGELEVLDRPFSEFRWPIRIYNTFDVLLEYEKGMVAIMVNTNRGYTRLVELTNEKVVRFFESCKPEGMLHNFQVLDRVVRGCSM